MDLCVVPSPPPGRPLIWARQGSDGLWHPANANGTLRCAGMHDSRLRKVVPVDDVPRRWAVLVPGRDRCSYRPWPGPADGVGEVPIRTPPVPLAGAEVMARELWLTLLSVQGHRCAVCGGTPRVIDHGPDLAIRGLLCGRCRRVVNTCPHTPACFSTYRDKPPARVFRWRLAAPIRQGAS